ncbi:hypothetical protein ACP70R_029268 [Stipagrostis hirtigluma subsp. patula]
MGAKMATTMRSARPAVEPAAAISSVLGDDDLLGEILLRLALPTDLVRAAAVCRRWLRRLPPRLPPPLPRPPPAPAPLLLPHSLADP